MVGAAAAPRPQSRPRRLQAEADTPQPKVGDGPIAGESSNDLMSPKPEPTCCLAWAITQVNREMISARQLRAFHIELQALVALAEAECIEVGATYGVIRATKAIRPKAAGPRLNTVDIMLRLGQLICRWGATEDPEVSFRIGVHYGDLQWLALPGSGARGYFGKAVSVAKHLAETAPKDNCVHLLPATKHMLRVFERMTFTVCNNLVGTSGKTSYSLATWEEATDDEDKNAPAPTVRPLPTSLEASTMRQSRPGSLTSEIQHLSVEQFAGWLVSYGVDTTLFGRGQAKSLASFLKELVQTRSSYLVEKEGELERRREIVRITLVAASPNGQDHHLMIASDIMDDGRLRNRNQKLGVTVPESTTWQEAVKLKFLEIFGLSDEVQREVFSVEANEYKEESMPSASIPGIATVYMTHEVRIKVLDPHREGLQAIGLPNMESFVTGSDQRGKENWAWTPAHDKKPNQADSLRELLMNYHISMEDFDEHAFTDLMEEVYETRISTLTVRNKELTRNTQIIKVWISADILSVPHLLVHKSKKQRGKIDIRMKDRPISMRLKHGESWKQALPKALADRLGLERDQQKDSIDIDEGSYRLCEEVEYSRSYPGLKTVYRIHEVTCRAASNCTKLGLPTGHDLGFTRGSDSDTVVTEFNWRARRDLFRNVSLRSRSFFDELVTEDPNKLDPKRRLPAPKPLMSSIAGGAQPKRNSALGMAAGQSTTVVEDVMKGRQADWTRARNAAKRIRDRDYTCKHFYEDCVAAFPELALYMGVAGPDGAPPSVTTSSGRSADDEYQRTLGALFAVYWLMRLNTDGAQSFCFGVGGDDWAPLGADSRSPKRSGDEIGKRRNFLQQVDWALFDEVLVAAGILKPKPGGAANDFVHDEDRTLGMLALTAIHDIMKVDGLSPAVAGWREFCGYKPGEVITDHDVALGYVLEHLPDALPSYAGLPQKQKDSVKFTQCNMEYNMGWLVQAEAPPGGLFKKFREIICAGKADPQDIAFYFTHWLTDLAGAEPYPQEGAEKFVLKFPMKVLISFLRSFEFVGHLSDQTETEVFERYLEWRWNSHDPSLGPAPTDAGSIAMMRLVVMAQGSSSIWLEAFRNLSDSHHGVLASELACTGAVDQRYLRDSGAPEGGPAFLLYYAPALLHKNTAEAQGALEVLAEILKQARSMWPADDTAGGEVVTVMLDVLKELTVRAMQQLAPGEVWALQRLTSKSAQIKKLSMLKGVDSFEWSNLRVLSFGNQSGQQALFPEQERDLVFGTADAMLSSLSELHYPEDREVNRCGWSCWPAPAGTLRGR